ncbi:MAG TPA: hypothetical protein VGO67_11970 [Verrucomicrobiae bacterium]|jgi:hypothetical protein
MVPKECIHIVPALPPQAGDVGEYALNLGLHLRQLHGIKSQFIVCDPDWRGPSHINGFAVRSLRLRKEPGIWAILASAKEKYAAVLLHYAAYGYNKLGVPLWLYRGIQSWLEDNNDRTGASLKQFCTVFHDGWAPAAKPWKTEFYLQKLRRSVVRGLHRRSKISVTSTRRMQALLDNIQPHKTLWLPVPSNIPTIERTKTGGGRNTRLRVAIYGGQESRSATVRAHANLLRTLDEKNLLGDAMLFGEETVDSESQACDLGFLRTVISRGRVEVLGGLNPEKVSEMLGCADIFLSHLSGQFACRSSAFMAALAARCPAVLHDGENAAPLHESEHFIASDDSQASVQRFERVSADGQLDRVATAGRLWYERYADWNVITRKYQEAFSQDANL